MKTCICPDVTEVQAAVALGGWAAFNWPPPQTLMVNPMCPLHGGGHPVTPPQVIPDAIALAAQTYAGYLVGHPYRAAQFPALRTVTVDKSKPWREPAIIPDECIFCMRMTDEDVVRRVAGFQGQIDKEVLRLKGKHYGAWLREGEGVPAPEEGHESDVNRRAFVLARQNVRTEKRPKGWREKPFPLVDLPMRLKRKLCITWNHIYGSWLADNPHIYYDFDKRAFFRNTEIMEEEG